MRLVEVTLEEIPGTAGAVTYPFEAGFNSWKQKGSVSLTSVIDILLSLFYPAQEATGPLGPLKAARGSVIFEVDRKTYRIQRDYARRTIELGEKEPGSSERYRELAREGRTVTDMLSRLVGLPSRQVFSTLLVARPGRIPDLSDLSSLLPGDPAVSSSGTGACAADRLAQLQREKERVEEVRELEFSLDGYQARHFEVQDELRKLQEPRDELAEIEAAGKEFAIYDEPGLITPEIIRRLQTFPKLGEEKEKELTEIEEREQGGTDALATYPERPFWREPLAIGGLSAAIVCFVAASFFRSVFWIFLILVVIGLAVMVWGLLKGIRREEEIKELQKNLQNFNSERAGIEKRFEIETTAIRQLCQKVGVDDTEDILEVLARREEYLEKKRAAEEKVAELEKRIPESELLAKRETLKQKISGIEQTLREMPPLSVDPNALDQQIRELTANLKAGGGTTEEYGGMEELASIDILIALAGVALEEPAAHLLNRMKQGWAKNLMTLTDRHFSGVEIRGARVALFLKPEGPGVAWAELSEGEKLAVFFSTQFTLWQMLVAKRSLPLILDLISSRPPEGLGKLSLAASRFVASQTQVLTLIP